jgi:hypothetical protein
VDDVHSGGHIDGDGGAVGRHVEWQDDVNGLHVCDLHVGREKLSVVSMLTKLAVVMLISDQSCWSRWSSNLEKKKMLFWIVNTSSTLILLSTMMVM